MFWQVRQNTPFQRWVLGIIVGGQRNSTKVSAGVFQFMEGKSDEKSRRLVEPAALEFPAMEDYFLALVSWTSDMSNAWE